MTSPERAHLPVPFNGQRAERAKIKRQQFWFHWAAKQARSYACGREEEFWRHMKRNCETVTRWIAP